MSLRKPSRESAGLSLALSLVACTIEPSQRPADMTTIYTGAPVVCADIEDPDRDGGVVFSVELKPGDITFGSIGKDCREKLLGNCFPYVYVIKQPVEKCKLSDGRPGVKSICSFETFPPDGGSQQWQTRTCISEEVWHSLDYDLDAGTRRSDAK